jgi:hypothetical protein
MRNKDAYKQAEKEAIKTATENRMHKSKNPLPLPQANSAHVILRTPGFV